MVLDFRGVVMKPVEVSTTIQRSPVEVFEFLDVLANHEQFTDHMLVDWTVTGPAKGVGASAHIKVKTPMRAQWVDVTVLESQAPTRNVEETVGAGGRRRSRGTYTLEPAPGGGTHVRFEVALLRAPAAERLLAPLAAGWLRKGNQRAM